MIDPLLFVLAWMLGGALFVPVLGEAGPWVALLALFGVYLLLLGRGTTFGKLVLGEHVVRRNDGGPPGLSRTLVGEVFGKVLSGFGVRPRVSVGAVGQRQAGLARQAGGDGGGHPSVGDCPEHPSGFSSFERDVELNDALPVR